MINDEKLCVIILALLLAVLIVFFFILFIEDFNHQRLHNEGYEVIDHIQCTDYLGRPMYYNVVKYKDGCIEQRLIPSAKYYEEMNKNEFN